VYAYPFQNHAPMEPMNATASTRRSAARLGADSEGRGRVRGDDRCGRASRREVRGYKINLGGGFGRRGAFTTTVTQAVLIAKQVPGTPVKLCGRAKKT